MIDFTFSCCKYNIQWIHTDFSSLRWGGPLPVAHVHESMVGWWLTGTWHFRERRGGGVLLFSALESSILFGQNATISICVQQGMSGSLSHRARRTVESKRWCQVGEWPHALSSLNDVCVCIPAWLTAGVADKRWSSAAFWLDIFQSQIQAFFSIFNVHFQSISSTLQLCLIKYSTVYSD